MRQRTWLWLALAVAVALVVSYQVQATSARRQAGAFIAQADVPTVAPGVDILNGVAIIPARIRRYDYRRAAFGEAWTDDNEAPGGHNGCDTRDDILDRDLVDKTYVSVTRCPNAVATGILHDPYTSATVEFARGERTSADVQIDHLVPLALAWDLGAYAWPQGKRVRFANDPANLLAVAGKVNEDKGDQAPGGWMPPNRAFWCQYSVQFADVLHGYGLPIDPASAAVLRKGAATCPTDS